MAKDKIRFDKIIPDQKDIHLARKDSKILSMGFGIAKGKILNDNNTVDLTINDLSYVPGLK